MGDLTGMPQNKKTKCGAMRGKGSYAFLDCISPVGAFVCKQSTPMLYIESNLVNYTYSTDDENQHRAELFERVWPPRLAGSPDPKYHMATIEVISETGCAYICSNLPGCRGFQLTCITSLICEKYYCLLISGI
ncbi:hypothetical protein LOTGIDRAFT_162539 [Lottia gigantea]|uniref:Uncharacterized protein n=1 Tax=Lottia gigantea TaxID=225164 RepID=V4A7A6_LOTGI|nr:hypothetical protein LOTGIDRAFT_162539 [Lottia gigantea]ESO92622.1 hypothetical protein LOTGIDRAFT_162539 [Lottia gigantea]